jgi:tetratricopeptide (TPR) repeat protein
MRPYDPKREARDRKYEGLVELGDRVLGTNPVAAASYYQRATVVDPYPTDAWLGLARAMDAQGKSAQALPAYRQAFNPPSGSGLYSSLPSDVASFARYGTLCEEAGLHEEAIKVYQETGARLNPKPDVPLEDDVLTPQQLRARLDVVRGIALAEAKEHSGQDRDREALQAFQKAAQEQPQDPKVQFYLGYGLQKVGKFAEAQAAFGRAAQADAGGTVRAAADEGLRAARAHRK